MDVPEDDKKIVGTASVCGSCGGNMCPFVSSVLTYSLCRAQGQGELYAYLPMTANNKKQLLAVPPRSTENADYGISVGRGAFNITPGTWTSVALRVKLNDLGIENGPYFIILVLISFSLIVNLR